MFRNSVYLLLAVLALGSCVKTHIPAWNEPSPISYQTVVSPVLKADDSNKYPESSIFRSTAFYNAPGNDSRSDAILYIQNEEVAFKNGVWTTNAKHYWPDEGSLSFLSYSPSVTPVNVTVDRNGISLNGWDVSSANAKNIDFMVADVRVGETKATHVDADGNLSSNGVPTIFRHKLSKISVSVRGDKGGSMTASSIVVKAVRLTNIYVVGDYKGGVFEPGSWTQLKNWWTDTWTTRGAAGIFVLYSDAMGHTVIDKAEYDQLGSTLMVIPQTLETNSKLEIDFTENDGPLTTVSVDIPDEYKKWEIGHSINYAISFNVGNIEMGATTGDWSNATGGSIIVGDK